MVVFGLTAVISRVQGLDLQEKDINYKKMSVPISQNLFFQLKLSENQRISVKQSGEIYTIGNLEQYFGKYKILLSKKKQVRKILY